MSTAHSAHSLASRASARDGSVVNLVQKGKRCHPPAVRAKTAAPAGPRVPKELLHVLKVWKLQCPPGEMDLVFPPPKGKPAHRSNVLRSGLYPALKRAELRTWRLL